MDDLSGKQLGAYRIVAPVGEGGMAAVFKAYQASMDRYVAVKVLPRQLAADPQFTARFENEARVLARLQHPHILPVFDFGQAEGYAYFVMPLVETGTLADRLRGRPLPIKQFSRFIIEIGNALEYAHTRGLVHRDVKPSNILLDESNNALLADFGIAKLLDGSVKFTATGALIGTPAYMSPEQGRGHPLDRRSDIYALGVILYELATGQVPFNGDTPVAIVYQHIHDALPLVEALNPSLPDALVRVIYTALAKDPADRFQTAHAMVEAVEAGARVVYRQLTPTVIEPVMPLPTSVVATPPTATPLPVSSTTPAPVPVEPAAPFTQLPLTAALETPPPFTPLDAYTPAAPPPDVGTLSAPLPPNAETLAEGATQRSALVAMVGVAGLVLVGLFCLSMVISPKILGLLTAQTATLTAAPTATVAAAINTAAPTVTRTASATWTATPSDILTTKLPPGVLAVAVVVSDTGARVRDTPTGTVSAILPNGTVVYIISLRQTTSNGIDWVKVRLPDTSTTGWVAEGLLQYNTAPPD